MSQLGTMSLPNLFKDVSIDSNTRNISSELCYDPHEFIIHWDSIQIFNGDDSEVYMYAISPNTILLGIVGTYLEGKCHPALSTAHFKLAVKKTKDSIFSSVFTYLPTHKFYRNAQNKISQLGFEFKATSYSGYFLVSDLDGTFRFGELYEDGELKLFFEPRRYNVPHTRALNILHEYNESDELPHVLIDFINSDHVKEEGLSYSIFEFGYGWNLGGSSGSGGSGGSSGSGGSGGSGGSSGSGGFGGSSGSSGSGGSSGSSGSGGSSSSGGSYTYKCSICHRPVNSCICNLGITVCHECGKNINMCICRNKCRFCKQYPCVCTTCPYCGRYRCNGTCRTGGASGEGSSGKSGEGRGNDSSKFPPGSDKIDNPVPPPIAPLAKQIFKNNNMIEETWVKLETMLKKILEDCMGQSLYRELRDYLQEKRLSIIFLANSDASEFELRKSRIWLGVDGFESNRLFHEMFHAYQAYQETEESFRQSELNIEIEAHFAQYLYLCNLREYIGSIWEQWYTSGIDKRMESVKQIERYVTNKGGFRDSKSQVELERHIIDNVIPGFRTITAYQHSIYNSQRTFISNFKNIKKLTKDC